MRSSKSRSRNKQNNNNNNRNRQVGNVVNRVFDSSGPEGKVRGTPQQIIEKYTQLARDAQLSNDRVAHENFQQHAEHYTRMLGEALREMEALRISQEQYHQNRNANGGHNQQHQQREEGDDQNRREQHVDAPIVEEQAAPSEATYVRNEQPSYIVPDEQPEVGPDAFGFEPEADAVSADVLVETPENRPPRNRHPSQRPRKPRPQRDETPTEAAE
jgi:hypothetical protein